MTLDELAAQEAAIERDLAGPGFDDELKRRATGANVPHRWIAVHRDYAALFSEKDARSLEALKRAVFLQWFRCAEPVFLTGMWAEWDPEAVHLTWAELEAQLQAEPPDRELRAMVAYYYNVCAWPFEQPPAPPRLAPLVEAVAREGRADVTWTAEQFAHRGQLGSYWRAVHRVA
jgi:hypothetical protein